MSQVNPSRFVWFWTFWHWSKESFRGGSLLRSPLNGVGSHWDEWFRHEASVHDRLAIEETGRSETSQRQFIGWLLQHWSREELEDGNRLTARFVLSELGQLPPFSHWPSFGKYRASYNVGGVSAVILAEGSLGEPEDIRTVEAIALPADALTAPIVPEGFQIDSSELTTPRLAAMNLLGGQSFLIFLALWMIGGGRPYPRWLHVLLGLGWCAVGGLMACLLVGPDPGDRLFWINLLLLVLWSALLLHAAIVVGVQSVVAWREGRRLKSHLERSQVRMRMKGGLMLKGGSAGLAFCLNTLQAIYRSRPLAKRNSWVWRRFFEQLESEGQLWAVTGALTGDGRITPVVIEPKIRACLRHTDIRNIFAPYQREARQQNVNRMVSAPATRESAHVLIGEGIPRLGFAAESYSLRSHRGLHIAQAMMTLGGFSSRWQTAVNGLAAVICAIMLVALPDVWSTVLPPLAPAVVSPGSPSPYYLWVSLDTKQAGSFRVVLESGFWANRRTEVKTYSGANASVRAEIPLHRLDLQTAFDEEDGVIWIERRHRFLNREFALGDRVGRYTVSFLTRIDHE
jgi:hypothetical protein